MDKALGMAKQRWHQEREEKRISGFVGRAKDSAMSGSSSGLVSRAKDTSSGLLGRSNTSGSSTTAASHSAQPLSALRDPSSFAPPPKSIHHPGYNPAVDGPGSAPAVPPRQGSDLAVRAGSDASAKRSPDTSEPPPLAPFRVNTTGLSTDGFVAPPTRIVQRSDTGGSAASPPAKKPPPSLPSRGASSAGAPAPATKPKPALPPRLPPRADTASQPASPPAPNSPPRPSPPSNDAALLNQGAVDRLAAAGVNVPGFGIGGGDGAASSYGAKADLAGHMPGRDANVSELQARFAKIRATEREHEEGAGVAAPTPAAGKRAPPVPMGTKPR